MHRFLSAHAAVSNLLNLGRHLVRAEHSRDLRVSAFNQWNIAVGKTKAPNFTNPQKLICSNTVKNIPNIFRALPLRQKLLAKSLIDSIL